MGKVDEALDELAALYEGGALQASTDPVAFLRRVIDDVRGRQFVIAAAYRDMADRCDAIVEKFDREYNDRAAVFGMRVMATELGRQIRKGTPADAQKALDAMLDEARRAGHDDGRFAERLVNQHLCAEKVAASDAAGYARGVAEAAKVVGLAAEAERAGTVQPIMHERRTMSEHRELALLAVLDEILALAPTPAEKEGA